MLRFVISALLVLSTDVLPAEPLQEFVMFADADAGKIYQMRLDSENVVPSAIPFGKTTKITRPVALEYEKNDDRIYWTDVTLHAISRAFRNGTGYEKLFNDVYNAEGLTIDFAGGNLYWTSRSFQTIETSKLNGSFRKTLFKYYHDGNPLWDIIVDPIGGYMYWTTWGDRPRIERAYMNGENREDLVNKTLGWPNGLTLDHVYNKLYWVDPKQDRMEVMDLATGKRKVVLNQRSTFLGIPGGYLPTEINDPFGLTLLHDKLYWTDWNTKAVYRANVSTGANIVKMAGNLGKPMDILAYSATPKQQKKLYYTFYFAGGKNGNFYCHNPLYYVFCPAYMKSAHQCPEGYTKDREDTKCRLNCRDYVGDTWRCPCDDWMSCAAKENYTDGCSFTTYSSFTVRECSQVVKAGRCPSGGSQGSQQSCKNDAECPNGEKCCKSKCATIATIETHPCRTSNGGCDQLCLSVPGGHKCGCQDGFSYNKTLSRCVIDTKPTTTPPPTPTPKTCLSRSAPEHGSVTCDGDPVPQGGYCYFSCKPGYELVGFKTHFCYYGRWTDGRPTCNNVGCEDLYVSGEDFSKTSEISCGNSYIANSAMECSVTCQPGSETAIPSFLKLQCYNSKWIRQNNVGKYVELASSSAPPRCYKTTPQDPSPPYCPNGYLLTNTYKCGKILLNNFHSN